MHADPARGVTLRVAIDEQRALLRDGEAGREIHRGRRLADAALLIRYRKNPGHVERLTSSGGRAVGTGSENIAVRHHPTPEHIPIRPNVSRGTRPLCKHMFPLRDRRAVISSYDSMAFRRRGVRCEMWLRLPRHSHIYVEYRSPKTGSWHSIGVATREYVSNALDAVRGTSGWAITPTLLILPDVKGGALREVLDKALQLGAGLDHWSTPLATEH